MGKNIILFDTAHTKANLLPFTYTRPIGAIRIGIHTIAEKWQQSTEASIQFWVAEEYLALKYPLNIRDNESYILLQGNIIPNEEIVQTIGKLRIGEGIANNKGEQIAWHIMGTELEAWKTQSIKSTIVHSIHSNLIQVNNTYDIFASNDTALRQDFERITKNRVSAPIPEGTVAINAENIFIEKGAVITCAILNASTGPIYIGKDAEIMEGCKIRGPFALCEHAGLKMDAKIYGATTIGPYCKAGGELNNVVMFGYSNKGHDGFLGNAVIGEWCNLGADTNNSNLKNTYEEVKLWNYRTERFERTGLTFCGLMMGDHAKCGINTMFNTGTVVGVGANIFGAGFPRNFIPSFAWGGAHGFETFQLNKFYKTAEAMCSRRGIIFDDTDKQLIAAVFAQSAKHRFWEKEQTTNPTQ
jgi:UDP-N-acetylglucosamine diphosphorylase/glucosamine-1-phosphate N-acetyltransferase